MARLCGEGIQAEALALYCVYSRVWREGVQTGSLERYVVLARVWKDGIQAESPALYAVFARVWREGVQAGSPELYVEVAQLCREGLQAGSLARYVVLVRVRNAYSQDRHWAYVHTKMAFLGRTMAWALPMATLGYCCAMWDDMGSCCSYVPWQWSYTAGHLVARLELG